MPSKNVQISCENREARGEKRILGASQDRDMLTSEERIRGAPQDLELRCPSERKVYRSCKEMNDLPARNVPFRYGRAAEI